MKNNKETRDELAKQLTSMMSEVNEIYSNSNYKAASYIRFNIPLKEPYKVLKVKEWLQFQKDIKNISYSNRRTGEVEEASGGGFIVKSRTSFLSPNSDLTKAIGIDAEAMLTNLLREEIEKAIVEQVEKTKENGTFKSRPQKN